jgi:hypothetical protein
VREDEAGPNVPSEAGSMLLKTAGVLLSPYQPTPKPSPFVVSAPSFEWRLWSMSEWAGL